MNFETFAPERRGREHVSYGPSVRFTRRTETAEGKRTGGNLRISREALLLIGIEPKRGDHFYFVVEVDREAGAIRLTPTEDAFTGRLMNPMNRQISVSKAFQEWTGWADSRWALEVVDGALYGPIRKELTPSDTTPKETP